VVTVTGSGWPPGDTIEVRWDTTLAQTTADANGNIQVSFTVPADAAEGEHDVFIRDPEPGMGGVDVHLPFRVTGPSAQCVPKLTVQRVFTQDTGGIEKTTFAPGDTIRFVAELNNAYGGYLLGAHGAQLSIGTNFYTDTHPVDFPPGISTWTWEATAPSTTGNYTVAVRAYDSFCGMWVGGVGENGSFIITGPDETPPPGTTSYGSIAYSVSLQKSFIMISDSKEGAEEGAWNSCVEAGKQAGSQFKDDSFCCLGCQWLYVHRHRLLIVKSQRLGSWLEGYTSRWGELGGAELPG
jgi:hypothetical protein